VDLVPLSSPLSKEDCGTPRWVKSEGTEEQTSKHEFFK